MSRLASLLFHDVYRRAPSESGFLGAVADRYKVSRTEFEGMVRALATPAPAVRTIGSADDLEGPDGLLLTVDDGGRSYASDIADVLEDRGWRGHAFVTTRRIGTPGFLSVTELRDLDRRGHVIGSHSATHTADWRTWPPAAMRREWSESRTRLEDLLGHEVLVASLPGGALSEGAALAASAAGLRVLFTSEPVFTPWTIGDCTLAGRFTVRPGHAPSELAALAAGAGWPLCRQWLSWNAKKAVKPLLGRAYPRLSAWMTGRDHAQV